MERIDYEIEDRQAVMDQIAADGKAVVEDVTINIVDGRLTSCYLLVVEAQNESADMSAALAVLGVEPLEED